ncbi:unnamed protein product [Prorocentrum cordatum]|uniref:Uncharacterized protein n=1 Tax=Prorocentrum cordatum TaxID=2364126 RepID=A0ABN9X328_9DINO|nr:unnamed protein product [Polarella glacialis]
MSPVSSEGWFATLPPPCLQICPSPGRSSAPCATHHLPPRRLARSACASAAKFAVSSSFSRAGKAFALFAAPLLAASRVSSRAYVMAVARRAGSRSSPGRLIFNLCAVPTSHVWAKQTSSNVVALDASASRAIARGPARLADGGVVGWTQR